MVKQYKVDAVKGFKEKLGKKNNLILTSFNGISVANMSILRKQLKEKNADYKVIKNTYFRRAMKEAGMVAIDDHLKGPIAVAFTDSDLGEIAKICKEFQKENKNFNFFLGVSENVVYNDIDIKKIADLPSKEMIFAQIAIGMNQVMSSLARGINEVAKLKEQA